MSKKIVISGVSKGLGYQLAEAFTVMGHKVAGCSRSGEGPCCMVLCSSVDITEPLSVKAFADNVISVMGAPDILINNAAVMNRPANVWEVPADEFNMLMDINVSGTMNVIRAFYPAMEKSGEGVIVNMSSGWGRSVSPKVAPYCASKYAIEGLSMAMAQEVHGGIAVVSLNPGFINTDMVKGVFGTEASSAEDPAEWGKRASSFILKLGRNDNGKQLTV
ncbi:short-chain dehydrogenase/reductase SDR [Denitrovibrio acetiphilus DSM 12809]|uniref:Short-chain dehydrogenase/reductase SDR n=1 Tax=Denitrovibrio acetiphilus (strain DSM 12809 / NBRC 114555 / N2460) TaxID=522772 RepID=D4H1K8_DENA2|nr:SDR family NAD(P)-dependent oxidoreductase [Denitrovibrio acetiphilus]ADD68768.1 short-chain dehydrogenase/reductase SDR [Denitrovibrio acetiphilus DSM 12809]